MLQTNVAGCWHTVGSVVHQEIVKGEVVGGGGVWAATTVVGGLGHPSWISAGEGMMLVAFLMCGWLHGGGGPKVCEGDAWSRVGNPRGPSCKTLECTVCLLCIIAIGLVRPESSDPQGVMIITAHIPNTSRYPWPPWSHAD